MKPGAGGLRDDGAILLLSCYELGHAPHGLASPLGFLERAGFRPAACDLSTDRLDGAAVARARLCGISVPMHTALRLGARVGAEVRRLNPGVHLCYYGLYAPLNQRYLRAQGADSILGGEHEQSLVDLALAIERGEPRPAADGPGVTLARLDFALPSRARLRPLADYARVLRGDGSEGVAGYTEASRGCLHRCRHCPIPSVYEGRFFVVPVAKVVADVAALVAAGATHVTFGDPDFLNGPAHALAVARAVHAEFPSLSFDVTAKIEHLLRHREALPELGRLGCLFVVSAVESLSPRVLEILDKGHTRDDVGIALDACERAGIALRPSLVPFTPWSTLEDYLELLDFVVARDLIEAVDPVQLSIRLLVPPGSLLERHPEMLPHLDHGVGAGGLDEPAFTYRWRHPDPRLDALQRAVSAEVERAAEHDTPARATFAAIAELARTAAGLPARASEIPPPRRKTPRLSEPWFC